MVKPKRNEQSAEYLLEKADLLLGRLRKDVKDKAKSQRKCTACGSEPVVYRGLGQNCIDINRAARIDRKAGTTWFSTNGYKYIYDDELKPQLFSRWRMAQILGRPLAAYEQVTYRNGNKAETSDDNLMLTLKGGFDLTSLVCGHCGMGYLECSPIEPNASDKVL